MNETLLKKAIAENIAYYRKQAGLTQSDLSEKINYSDKSVSKWERAEGIPDVIVLSELADLFGVTLNDLVSAGPKRNTGLRRTRTRGFITCLSAGLPWLVAAIVFFIVRMVLPEFEFAKNFFVYAIAVSGIVATVLTSIWFSPLAQMFSVSLIIWGCALSVHLSFFLPQASYIYIIAAVMQILTLLWYLMKRFSKKDT